MNFWYECCIVTRQWDPELTVSYGCYMLQQLTSVKIRTMHSVMLPLECLVIITYQSEHWESKQFLCPISSQTLWVNFESVPLMTSTLYFWLWHCYGRFLPSYFTALLHCRSPEISLMTPHCWFSHVFSSLVILPIPLLGLVLLDSHTSCLRCPPPHLPLVHTRCQPSIQPRSSLGSLCSDLTKWYISS